MGLWNLVKNRLGNSAKQVRRVRRSTRGPAGIEALERRQVFAAPQAAVTLGEAGAYAEHDQDPMTIAAVHLLVGDDTVTVTRRNEVVTFKPDQEISVIGIDYVVNEKAGGWEGVVAFEGFLRRAKESRYLGEFDYGDGRFGAAPPEDGLAIGSHRVDGLAGSWTLDEHVNRLSIAMLHYQGDDYAAQDRFFVNFQPANIDLVMNKGGYKVSGVGREANFYGSLINQGSVEVTTYSEVNVFDVNDLSQPVWVGTFTLTLQPGEKSALVEYTNTNDADAYATRWTPTRSGKYLVKVFADPENHLLETNESNNVRSTIFDVR